MISQNVFIQDGDAFSSCFEIILFQHCFSIMRFFYVFNESMPSVWAWWRLRRQALPKTMGVAGTCKHKIASVFSHLMNAAFVLHCSSLEGASRSLAKKTTPHSLVATEFKQLSMKADRKFAQLDPN